MHCKENQAGSLCVATNDELFIIQKAGNESVLYDLEMDVEKTVSECIIDLKVFKLYTIERRYMDLGIEDRRM